MKKKNGRPFGAKTKPPIILEPNFLKEMAIERAQAAEHRALKVKKGADAGEIEYLLSLLEEFDRAVRPTVPVISTATGQRRFTPIQLYEAVLSYFQNCIKYGRNMTISHLCWYCGYDRQGFLDFTNGKDADPNYAFLKTCLAFMEGHIEYRAQDKQNPAFHIFWLKNRGWKDKFEVEASSTMGALTAEEREIAQKRIAEFSEGKYTPGSIEPDSVLNGTLRK